MTERQLSPGARAALDAGMEYSGPAFEPLVRRMVAAALRAAVKQTRKRKVLKTLGVTMAKSPIYCLEADLLTIADELEETLQ